MIFYGLVYAAGRLGSASLNAPNEDVITASKTPALKLPLLFATDRSQLV